MRGIGIFGLASLVLGACSGGGAVTPTPGTTEPQGHQTSPQSVMCSASLGPIMLGPSGTLADGGDVQECGPGGTCSNIVSPGIGPGGGSQPTWKCVYQSGVSGQGDGG
jgi:hypothetical protein